MVSHHCTRDVVVGQRNETLGQAAQRMRQSHVGDLVVVDNLENRVPIGILTDRDIVVGPVAQAAEQIATLTIGDVMTTPTDHRAGVGVARRGPDHDGPARCPAAAGD
jgi:CBS domain-containing protein